MKRLQLFLVFLAYPMINFANVLIVSTNNWGKLPNLSWNGTTPIAVNHLLDLKISAIINKTEIPFEKTLETNFEKIVHVFRPPIALTNYNRLRLKITKPEAKFFNNYKINVNILQNQPTLEILEISPTITHGGSGIVLLKSNPAKDLNFLGLIDEKGVVFYPKTFIKDGYYAIVFPWYSDYSKVLSKQYILAIDHAGNTNSIPIDTKPKLRSYVKKQINLPNNYASQKAKELSLSAEEAKKLEGNFDAINKQLSVKSVSRWDLTRKKDFKESVQEIISHANIFSSPSKPMLNAITTSTYGDQRNYVYKKKIVRNSVHRGLDFASVKNAPIYALMDGIVVYADWNSGNGKSIYIDHGAGVYSMYAHNEELLVKAGQKVKSGEQISISGTTGQSTGDHLHLSIIVQGMYVEPEEWLSHDNIIKLFLNPMKNAADYIENNTKTNKKSASY